MALSLTRHDEKLLEPIRYTQHKPPYCVQCSQNVIYVTFANVEC